MSEIKDLIVPRRIQTKDEEAPKPESSDKMGNKKLVTTNDTAKQ